MIKAIDLFAGCGGLSKGFLDAGIEVLLGVDNNDVALKTFEYNHENSKVLNCDLSDKKSLKMIDESISSQKIDLIIAGPPCQGFSLSGPRKFDDERNKLYLSVFDAVDYFKPRAFVIENVIGMATLYKGQVREEIIKRFEKLGYTVSNKILNSADYGVPQKRKRLFFVGITKDIAYNRFTFPLPTLSNENYVSARDALDDLPSRENEVGDNESSYDKKPRTEYQRYIRANSTILHNHVGTRHTELVKNVISLVPEGGNHKDLPEGVGTSRKFNEAWTRCDGHMPAKTVDTGHRNYFHYKYNRVPTVRENARLQSFKDDFVFFGNKTQQYRQVGNAVPPLLGYHIAKEIIKVLE